MGFIRKMTKNLQFSLPKRSRRILFYDDFIGNAGDVLDCFSKNSQGVEEVHSVWWDVKAEEKAGKILE